MTYHTKMSAKGQVVIPKDVRDRLGLVEGATLDVIETVHGVFLRAPDQGATISLDELLANLDRVVAYNGPPLPVERLSWSAEVDEEFERAAG